MNIGDQASAVLRTYRPAILLDMADRSGRPTRSPKNRGRPKSTPQALRNMGLPAPQCGSAPTIDAKRQALYLAGSSYSDPTGGNRRPHSCRLGAPADAKAWRKRSTSFAFVAKARGWHRRQAMRRPFMEPSSLARIFGRVERGGSSLVGAIGRSSQGPKRDTFRSRPTMGYCATTPTLPFSYEFVIARWRTIQARAFALPLKTPRRPHQSSSRR